MLRVKRFLVKAWLGEAFPYMHFSGASDLMPTMFDATVLCGQCYHVLAPTYDDHSFVCDNRSGMYHIPGAPWLFLAAYHTTDAAGGHDVTSSLRESAVQVDTVASRTFHQSTVL